MSKTTAIKKIGGLGIFVADGRNRTYLLNSETKLRRFDHLAASLIQAKMAVAQPGSRGDGYSLIIVSNIQEGR